MGALYAWCCMRYADASLTPSRCGWRIVVESASEMINNAKITQKVTPYSRHKSCYHCVSMVIFKLKPGAHPQGIQIIAIRSAIFRLGKRRIRRQVRVK